MDIDGHGFCLPPKNTKSTKDWSADFQIGTAATERQRLVLSLACRAVAERKRVTRHLSLGCGSAYSRCHEQSQSTGNRSGLSRRNHGPQNFPRHGGRGKRDRGQSRLAAGDHVETPGWHHQERPPERFPGAKQRRAEKNLPCQTG